MNHECKDSCPHDLPCVWMEAGLVAYKLCDRDLRCDGCPFDAAFRGNSSARSESSPVCPMTFPEDRRYTRGHQWLQGRTVGSVRIGVDTMVGQLAGPVLGVQCLSQTSRLGKPLFEIELEEGRVLLRSITEAIDVRINPRLEQDPSALSSDPYGEGWIAELDRIESIDDEATLTASEARAQARLDVRAVRRRVAMLLLAEADELGPTLADGGVLETDLASMIGAQRYFEILREVLY